MSNRFHNKFHRANHHSQVTAKNNSIVDSSLDPIASYSEPFQGEFYTDGEIITNSFLSAAGNIESGANLAVTGNVYATNAVLSGNLVVGGNLQVEGNVTQLDTLVYTTSAISVSNSGTGPALRVIQTGNQSIAEFYDDGVIALFIDGRVGTDGNVGIGTNNPTERLTVVGSITSNEIIYDANGNSTQWNRSYTNVSANSATWNQNVTDLRALSGNWQSTYTTVQTNSATNWNNDVIRNYVHNNFIPLSGGTITGNLSVLGDVTYIDTAVAVTSAVYIDTTSADTALRITQRGPGDAIRVEDDTATPDATPFIVKTDGAVGIGTAIPNEKLTVVGNVTASGNIYADSINLSSITFTKETVSSTTSVTATDAYIKVVINGQPKYLRLFDVI